MNIQIATNACQKIYMYMVIKMNMVLMIANYVAQKKFLVPNSNYLSHYIIESHLFKQNL